MARQPNLKVNGELLDKTIKSIEGDKFDMAKISTFILNKEKTYYRKCLLQNNLSEDALKRICEYYELKREDYIITEEVEKKQIQEKADTMNYENVIILLTGIDKTFKELLAQQKSTNYILGEIKTSLMNESKNTKEILGKLETLEKRQQRYGKYQ